MSHCYQSVLFQRRAVKCQRFLNYDLLSVVTVQYSSLLYSNPPKLLQGYYQNIRKPSSVVYLMGIDSVQNV